MKTDNDNLFDFTLEELPEADFRLDVLSRDLHNSEYNEGNIRTEYEENFSSMGVSINMLEVVKPEGFEIAIPENLSRDRKRYGVD